MFGMSLTEILLILAVALIILGPEKLPELARTLGKGVRQMRRAAMDVRRAIDFDDVRSGFDPQGAPPNTQPIDPYRAAAQEDDADASLQPEPVDEFIPAERFSAPTGHFQVQPRPTTSGLAKMVLGDPLPGGETRTIAEGVVAVGLAPWLSLTGIGVTMRTETMFASPVSLLDSLVSVPVSIGLLANQPSLHQVEEAGPSSHSRITREHPLVSLAELAASGEPAAAQRVRDEVDDDVVLEGLADLETVDEQSKAHS